MKSSTFDERLTCTKCHTSFPKTKEFFHSRKSSLGFTSQCKVCRNRLSRETALNNPETVLSTRKKSYEKNKEKRLKASRDWFEKHPTYSAERYRKNPEAGRIKAREYRESLSREKKQEIYLKSKERQAQWRNSNKDKIKKYLKEYKVRNRYKVASIQANYKARRRKAEGSFSEEDIKRLLNEQDSICKYCPADISIYYEIDHVIPVSKNGTNWPSNLVLCCKSCNASKGNRTLEEWRSKI